MVCRVARKLWAFCMFHNPEWSTLVWASVSVAMGSFERSEGPLRYVGSQTWALFRSWGLFVGCQQTCKFEYLNTLWIEHSCMLLRRVF